MRAIIFARRPVSSCQLSFGNGKHYCTTTKEQIPQDGVRTHLDVDGDNTSLNEPISLTGNIRIVYALVDLVEVVIHFLQPLPHC